MHTVDTGDAITTAVQELIKPLQQHLCEDPYDGPLIYVTILDLVLVAGTQRCCRWQPEGGVQVQLAIKNTIEHAYMILTVHMMQPLSGVEAYAEMERKL
jgi:hypothetical protein